MFKQSITISLSGALHSSPLCGDKTLAREHIMNETEQKNSFFCAPPPPTPAEIFFMNKFQLVVANIEAPFFAVSTPSVRKHKGAYSSL